MDADAQLYLEIMLRLCAVGVLVQTAEVLWQRDELKAERLLSLEGGVLSRYPGVLWALLGRAMVAVACLWVHYGSPMAFGFIGLLVLAQIHYNRRFAMLAGNCETMFLVCLVAAWMGTLPGAKPWLAGAALIFVALQTSLAYLVAGVHKLRSSVWRRGLRLAQIAQHGSYELPRVAHRSLALAGGPFWITQAVIVLEIALGFAVLLPPCVAWPLLGAGFLFHTSVALLMGLHGFWWSFAAAYPAMVYANGLLHRGGV